MVALGSDNQRSGRYALQQLMMVDSAALKWEPEPVDELIEQAPTLRAVPGLAARTPSVRGVVLVALGDGPDGLHREPKEMCLLEEHEALDLVGLDPHCPTTFVADNDGLRLDAVGAVDGVYVRISNPVPINHGDTFLIGMTRMRFEGARTRAGHDAWGALVRLREDGWPTERFEVLGLGATIGRSRGDVVLSHDPFLSHRHCRVVADSTGVYLDDLDSVNGTFRMVHPDEHLPVGSIIRVGESTLRIDALG